MVLQKTLELVLVCKGNNLDIEMWLNWLHCFIQEEGPTVRDLKVRYSTGKKTSKNKKKLEKAMKVLVVPLVLLAQTHTAPNFSFAFH